MAAVIDIDKGWKKIQREIGEAVKAPYVKVGVVQSKGAGTDRGGISMAGLAAVHEFGTGVTSSRSGGSIIEGGQIPPRSFIGSTFIKRKEELGKFEEGLVKKIVAGQMTTRKALALLGQWGAKEIKNFITQGEHIPPPLAPSTLKRKGPGKERPLVMTGTLVGAISYEVVA